MVVVTGSRRARRRSDEDDLSQVRASLAAPPSVPGDDLPVLAPMRSLRVRPMKTQTVYVYLTSKEVAKVKALMEERHLSIGHFIEEMVREALKAKEAK